MTTDAHLWAIGYEDMERADQVRDKIIQLAWGPGQAGRYLILEDIAVVVRHGDGTFTLDRKPFPGLGNIAACSAVGFLGGLGAGRPVHRRDHWRISRERRRGRSFKDRNQRGLHRGRGGDDEAGSVRTLRLG